MSVSYFPKNCPHSDFKEVTLLNPRKMGRGVCLQDWVTEKLLGNSDFGNNSSSERAPSDFLCMPLKTLFQALPGSGLRRSLSDSVSIA